MNSLRSLIGLTLLAAAPVAMLAQVSVAHEQHFVQTGASNTAFYSSTFYATVEGVTGVTSATVSAPSGPLTTPASLANQGDFFEYEDERTSGGLVTDYPLNTTYTITTAGTVGSVDITAPNNTLANMTPSRPVFSISNDVSGTWVGNTFRFNPTGVTSFTITLNNYTVTNSGGIYAYYLDVNGSGGFEDGVGIGPTPTSVAYTAPVITFTNGLAMDGGDGNPATYGFTAGSSYYLEAGFFNGINWQSGAYHGADVGYVTGATTGFNLQAIPEPSTYAAIFGALALAGVMVHRRRRA